VIRLSAVGIACLICAAPATAHLPYTPKCKSLDCVERSQQRNLAHAEWVARHGEGKHRRWARKAVVWLARELQQTYAWLHPPAPVSTPAVDGCLSELIERESHWVVTATNPSTGAYGLPQAVPGSKMASAGSDWATNPQTQIRWMLGYVQRYGGSCGALAFQRANGWY
jgi:hypothetical protein